MIFKFEHTVGYAIHRAAIALKQDLAHRLKGQDVTVEQFAILARLWEQDGISQRDLSSQLLKDKPNVTRILQKLEAKNFIERHPDKTDRRIYRVFLTPTGVNLRASLMPLVNNLREAAYADISPDVEDQLKQLLNKIADNLQQVSKC